MKCSIYQFCIVTLLAQYKINHRYVRVIYDETKAVAITDEQYIACQHANRQFCRINAPFQPLTNQPSCVTALYAKMTKQ